MPLLKKELKNDILSISLDDPKSRNAFSITMAEDLVGALSDSTYTGVFISAQGSTFCSGGNLRDYQKLSQRDEGLAINLKMTKILQQFSQLPVPTVAFVSGACYGGGVEFLSCFDWVFASPKSLFGLWQRRVGLTFGWGAEPRLIDKMGSSNTMNWLADGRTISCFQAKKLGLVDEIGLAGRGEEMAIGKINQIVQWGLESFALSKENRLSQQSAFEKLWLTGRHKKVLKKF